MAQVKDFLSDIGWEKWQSSHRLFALLDSAQLSDEDRREIQSLDSSLCLGLFKGTPEEELKDVEPLLIDVLNIQSPHDVSWLLEKEKTAPMLLWFVSDVPMSELTMHLRRLLSADLPGAPNALLRFYDPRVFKKLMLVLDLDQRKNFFEKYSQWWALDGVGGERETYRAPPGKIQPVDKIVLSELQMQILNQMDMDDFVKKTKADMVCNKASSLHTKNLSDADLERLVGEHINRAIAFGFESEEAVVAYLKHVACTLGWAYEEKDTRGVVLKLQDESLTEDEKLSFLSAVCVTG